MFGSLVQENGDFCFSVEVYSVSLIPIIKCSLDFDYGWELLPFEEKITGSLISIQKNINFPVNSVFLSTCLVLSIISGADAAAYESCCLG